MAESLKVFLDWLKENIPQIMGALVLGYKVGSGKLSEVKAELADEKLKARIKENHDEIDKLSSFFFH